MFEEAALKGWRQPPDLIDVMICLLELKDFYVSEMGNKLDIHGIGDGDLDNTADLELLALQ